MITDQIRVTETSALVFAFERCFIGDFFIAKSIEATIQILTLQLWARRLLPTYLVFGYLSEKWRGLTREDLH